jgi:peptide/nickel transport system substrate-binding protein
MLKPIPRVAAVALMITFPLLGFAAPSPSLAVRPVSGGTLRLVAAYGPDHLDPVSAYYSADYILERAYARQLVSYPSVPDPSVHSRGWNKDTTPVADVAKVVPTVANGGISDGGKIYTFHIRAGVEWNTSPPRQVTANDFVREFKAFCNPVPGGFVGNLGYYTNTIQGMGVYCRAEESHFARIRNPTARQVAAFQDSHSISGITVPDPMTIRFRLFAPASDFLNILALPFASARPVEDDRYLPDSLAFDRHFLSDGPYRLTSFQLGGSIVLTRNPAWHQSADPLRHQYAKTIILTSGIASAQTQIADLRSGLFDLMDDLAVPPSAYPRLRTDRDFHVWPGENLIPYVVFNFRSPNSRHAMGRLAVRRAIEFGVSKAAVQKVLGGAAIEPILNSVLAPGNLGALTKTPYPTPGGRGSATRCRALLARAGVRHGLKLRYFYPSYAMNSAVFAAIRAGLRPCGITLIGVPMPISTFFVHLSDTSLSNKRGTWDLAQPGWIGDWYGNGARSIMDPLFRSHCVLNTYNYGCYNSRLVDRLISEAETARSLSAAAGFWHRANEQIMTDAAFVPLVAGQNPIYASPRVRQAGVPHGVVFLPVLGGPDITNTWLANG